MKVLSLNKVENIVEKGEIGHYEHFNHLPQWFQKSSAEKHEKSPKVRALFMNSIEKNVAREIAYNEQFIYLPQRVQ